MLIPVLLVFEGNGKAALYTGDIRSEPWFVNAIARSPALIEYSCGLKTLDTIYLDTSFTDDFSFPPKSEGIRELLEKVSKYPKDTIFHFQAWTYGSVRLTHDGKQLLNTRAATRMCGLLCPRP